MPKNLVDYSKTIIYKIFCKDSNITDIYVGHTTNFTQRKYAHKIASNSQSKLKIYDTIRKNGGWDNWDMVEIACYNCKDAREARIKEHEHYKELKATLNSCPPCAIINNSAVFSCDLCNYQCNKKHHLKQHLLTKSHKDKEINTFNNVENSIACTIKKYTCLCGKNYKDRTGLWKHSKKCENKENNKDNFAEYQNSTNQEIISILIKENKEFKTMILEQNNIMMNMIKQIMNYQENIYNKTT
jgi:hypothetical protein